MKLALATGILALALAGCTAKEDRVTFDGLYFKTKSHKVDDDRSRFTVEVDRVSQSLDAAREAGGYEGTRYCITNFGTPRIAWAVGPETPPQALQVVKDTLIFQGECNP
ncbi:MAG: hypothetical protein VXW58_08710 [Pseudomonadota bacterium]|nr:hypothetical protein [Pseudomonadota bacterium]